MVDLQSTEPIDASLDPETDSRQISELASLSLPYGHSAFPSELAEVVDAWPELPEAL